MIRKLTEGAFAALVAAMLLLPFDTVRAGIPVGTWRSHPAYNNATFSLTAFSYVFVLSDGGLYFFDPADDGLYTIDRTGGLSDTDISAMAYCDSEKAILLVYSNGNIDILYENKTIYNFTESMTKFMSRLFLSIVHTRFSHDHPMSFPSNVNMSLKFFCINSFQLPGSERLSDVLAMNRPLSVPHIIVSWNNSTFFAGVSNLKVSLISLFRMSKW